MNRARTCCRLWSQQVGLSPELQKELALFFLQLDLDKRKMSVRGFHGLPRGAWTPGYHQSLSDSWSYSRYSGGGERRYVWLVRPPPLRPAVREERHPGAPDSEFVSLQQWTFTRLSQHTRHLITRFRERTGTRCGGGRNSGGTTDLTG